MTEIEFKIRWAKKQIAQDTRHWPLWDRIKFRFSSRYEGEIWSNVRSLAGKQYYLDRDQWI